MKIVNYQINEIILNMKCNGNFSYIVYVLLNTDTKRSLNFILRYDKRSYPLMCSTTFKNLYNIQMNYDLTVTYHKNSFSNIDEILEQIFNETINQIKSSI